MIYIATVHWKTDKWIDTQLNFIHKYITTEYKIFAFLNDILVDHSHKYYYSSDEKITCHATKLNILSNLIIQDSNEEEDVLIFLDGDAFPIGDIIAFGKEILIKWPLLAVRRFQELGDIQPHPCFCMTTVKFWKNMKGDWRSGYKWKDNKGNEISDVGGNLLGILNGKKIDWYPIERTNEKNLHPLLFGVYGDLIYHHGAGFRHPILRISEITTDSLPMQIQKIILTISPRRFRHFFPSLLRDKLRIKPKIKDCDVHLSEQIISCIMKNDYFIHKYFLSSSFEVFFFYM